MHIEADYRKTHGHDLSPFDSLFSGKPSVSNTKTQTEMSSSEAMLHEIAAVIKKVDKNQLSAGQGWRTVKHIMKDTSDEGTVSFA